jgi:hypothetical protein
LQGNRVEFYRQTIAKLISGLEPSDHAGRQVIYDRMRVTNEGYIEKNRDRLSDAQAQSMRAQLDDAVDETERSFAGIPLESPADDPLDLDGIPDRSDVLDDSYVPEEAEVREVSDIPDGMSDPLVMDDAGGRNAVDPASPQDASLPPPVATRPHSKPAAPFWREGRFLTGLAAGLVVGGLIAFGLLSQGAGTGPALPAEAAQRQAAFEADFQATREIADREIALMQRIEAALLERQQSDGIALARVAGRRFQKVEDVLPEFADVRKAVGDNHLTVWVRANENDFKIRFDSPLCATIRYVRPDLLDIRRPVEGIGCRFFGVWTEGGQKF